MDWGMDIEVMAVFMTGRDNKLLILIRLLTSVEHTIYRCICVSFINPDTEWFQVEKGVRQGCILSPNLFDIYSEDIMAWVANCNIKFREEWKSVEVEGIILYSQVIQQ